MQLHILSVEVPQYKLFHSPDKNNSIVEDRMRNCIFCPLSLFVTSCMHVYRRSERFLIVVNMAVEYVDTHDQSAFVVFSSTQSKSP